MKVIATDADQANTPHSAIHYSIVDSASSGGMFFMNSQTGEVMVQRNTLDREVSHSPEIPPLPSSVTNCANGNQIIITQ